MERDELSSLLPHKGKMLLLSRLREYDTRKRSLTAEYDISESCIFFDPKLGGIPSWVCFEFMAQSISTLSGLMGREAGLGPKPGFILSVSSMELKLSVLKPLTTAVIQVREDCRIDQVYTFNCEVMLGEKSAATAKLTVMDVDDIDQWEQEYHGN
jgi:predicted hotdog family 3-hydroxylacyl-ACP dehydratase